MIGSADEVHNVYGHEWTKLVFEGYEQDFPNQRPFILMRAGAAGSQRYGIIPWTGDVDRSWGGLKPQTELSLHMGMQGIAYLHSDLGGFAGGEVFDPELYTRWLQYGVFQPVFRPHAQEHIAPEPVFHDEKTKALAKKSIELRYSLIPYIYTLAFENSQTGMPFMRPLFFGEPENAALDTLGGTYLWGNDFLVSPVTEPGLKRKEIYFPAGSHWYDFFGDKKYEGGKTHKVRLQEDHIPVFVRAGSIIAMVEPVQTLANYSTENVQLHYYYDPRVNESSASLYDDDGKTPQAYEKGKYEIVSFNATSTSEKIDFSMKSETGMAWTAPDRKVALTISNLKKEPEMVRQGKIELPYAYYKGENKLEIKFEVDAGNNILVELIQ